MENRVGQKIGNYRLVRLLGAGGFAEVYLGEHIHLGTLAAIKFLHAQVGEHEKKKFLTEARIIARLVHPNIVRILDFGVEGYTPFLGSHWYITAEASKRCLCASGEHSLLCKASCCCFAICA